MLKFTKLNEVNGFDLKDLNNGRQNNYGWSVAQLGNYIYVGTGRNILYNLISSFKGPEPPLLVSPNTPIDNLAEIWRYNINNKDSWQRVFKSSTNEKILGFRSMIAYKPFNGYPALYAAGYSFPTVKIFKSTNGVNWFPLEDSILEGTSSRSMLSHCGKLYLATFDDINRKSIPLLYSSPDPEYVPWKLEINPNDSEFNPLLNPSGSIYNIASFNNKLYVSTSTETGCQLWRTNNSVPKINDWTLIADNGFGNPEYLYTLAFGSFKDYLYLSLTKELPLSWLIPSGCEVIRIDKNDNWQIVVGENSYNSCCCCRNNLPTSGPGFNNFFNVYAWQIIEYNKKLYISTFDDSSNMQVILETFLTNKSLIESIIGISDTRKLINFYSTVVKTLSKTHYPIGFDLYESTDGVNFNPVFLNGLNNPFNYGGRVLFKTDMNDLIISTSNPFQGCEVWKMDSYDASCPTRSFTNNYNSINELQCLFDDNYEFLVTTISKLLASL